MSAEEGEVFILTKQVNGSELNLGVFRSGWISEILSACFSLSFWAEFAFVVSLVYGSMCVCVPYLRYPQKGKIPWVYYYNYRSDQ